MVLAIKLTSTLWSEAMHLHPGARQFGETAEDGYQRSLDIPVPGEYNLHILATESGVGFAAPVLVGVSAQLVEP